jgi:amino acid permease
VQFTLKVVILNLWLILAGILIIGGSVWLTRSGSIIGRWIDRQNRRQDLIDFGGFIVYFIIAGFLVMSLGLVR